MTPRWGLAEERDDDDGWDVALAIIAWLLWTPTRYVWHGFVVMKVWNWFMPRSVSALPEIGMEAAVGAVFVWGLFVFGLSVRHGSDQGDDETHTHYIMRHALTRLFGYGFMLAVAWIAQLIAF